jgi:hypothetical protein
MATIERECERCGGTGECFDITCADRATGSAIQPCSRCKGSGKVAVVALATGPSAVELGALPEWDESAELPDWMC